MPKLKTCLVLLLTLHFSPALFALEPTQMQIAPDDEEIPLEPSSTELTSLKRESLANQNMSGVGLGDPTQTLTAEHPFRISGLANLDLFLSDRTANLSPNLFGRYGDHNSGGASLSNITLFADVAPISWLTVHTALLYSAPKSALTLYDHQNNFTFDNQQFAIKQGPFSLDEGFIRTANFTGSPFFLEMGRFYIPFGSYERYPITKTLTQQLTQTQGNGFEIGAINATGWSGIAYAFRGQSLSTSFLGHERQNKNNFGAEIAYNYNSGDASFSSDMGFLYDIGNTDLVASTIVPNAFRKNDRPVSAIAIDLLANTGALDGHLNFVTTFIPFSATDISYKGRGARPRALDIGAGYSFTLMNRDSRIGLSYQHSWESLGLGLAGAGLLIDHTPFSSMGLPEDRIQGDYAINLFKNTSLGFQLRYDSDYALDVGGTEKNALTGVVRFSVGLAC